MKTEVMNKNLVASQSAAAPPQHTQLPPGPRSHLGMSSAISFARDPLGYFCRVAKDYGDLVTIPFLGQQFFLANHPDLIEEVLVKQNQAFIKDKMLREYAKPVFGRGLLSSDGEFWLAQRRLAQPAFHRSRIAAYSETMTTFTERALANWHDGEVRDTHADMMHLTLEVVAKTLFNTAAAAEATAIGAALDAIMVRFDNQDLLMVLEQATGITLPTAKLRRYQAGVRNLDAIVFQLINERRAHPADTGDLLSMLLAARDEEGNGMNDQQLRDESVTIFLAGHETTALSLSWTWYLLAQHPEVAATLHAELQQVLDGRTPTLADLPALRYTEQVIQESMRLYPPAWAIQRETTRDVELGGYLIPKGSDVLMSQYVMHRDPRYFDQPERFYPARWANDFAKTLPKYAYFPFGGGPRLCIGVSFAMMEAVLMLATIAQQFELTLVPGQRIVPQPSITMRPKYGLQMRVRKR